PPADRRRDGIPAKPAETSGPDNASQLSFFRRARQATLHRRARQIPEIIRFRLLFSSPLVM
ncbi:MAG TPA: hypothetical protein VGI28_02810, partial [Stellaceae bacterium]